MNTFPSSLLAGYQTFRAGRYLRESPRYSTLAVQGQTPKILMIACCDSRAAPEIIFNAHPGEIFVIRNVANLVPPRKPDGEAHSTSAALEYAIEALKVEHIVVLGHGRCGGIAAALSPKPATQSSGDFIGKWMDLLQPAMANIKNEDDIPLAEKQHALEYASIQNSLQNLRSFPAIVELENAGKLHLHGAWFDISLGTLWVLDSKTSAFAQIKE